MNINENLTNKVKITEKKKENLQDLLVKSVIFLHAIYPRPLNMVPNLSLGSHLSSCVSHMQII